MYRRRVELALVFLLSGPALLSAQEFRVLNRTVQVHGFVSQGFVRTDENNWLTMNSSQGSGAFTDFGLNMSAPVTDKLRVGAQVYDRNLGQLGQYHPSLDWAYVDYRFRDWLGFRGGKVKTVLGLYNDTQDLDFLHTFALLPQSVYPADLRETTIAHRGGDLYGTIPLRHHLGDLSYTAYAGHRSDGVYSGYPFFLIQYGIHLSISGLQYGGDLRWNTPLKGLRVGVSRMNEDTTGKGSIVNPTGAGVVPYWERSKANSTSQFYGEYSFGKLRIASEYRRYVRDEIVENGTSEVYSDVRGWYVSGDYRISKWFDLGSYYSRYTATDAYGGAIVLAPNQTDTSLPNNHIYDKVITARFDLNKFWNVKVEGHFMNGYSYDSYPDGFYFQLNPGGFKPNTDALVMKTGINF